MNKRKVVIIFTAVVVIILALLGILLYKSLNNNNNNNNNDDDGSVAVKKEDNNSSEDEYCDIDWHDNVLFTDGWEIESLDNNKLVATPDDKIPDPEDYIILWDKYGVAYAKKVDDRGDLHGGKYVFDLLDVVDPSEVMDKISFSGTGDFSTLLGADSSNVSGRIDATKRNSPIGMPMSTVNAEPHSINTGTVKYELSCTLSADGTVKADISRSLQGVGSPEVKFDVEDSDKEEGSEISTKEKNADNQGEDQKNGKKKHDSSTELTVSGSLTIEDLTVYADGDIDFLKLGDSKLEAVVSANEIMALELTGKREDKIGLGAIPIPIAVTGGVVNVSIEPYLVFDMEGKVTVEYKIVGTRFDAYMDLSKSGPDFSKSTFGTPQDPQITVSTEIGAGLRVSADLQVVKTSIVDPYIEFDAKVTGTKNPVVKGWENVPPCFDADFGFPEIKAGCDFMEDAPFADKVKQAAGWDMSLETTLLSADNAPLKITGHFETDENTSEIVLAPDGKCTHEERAIKDYKTDDHFEIENVTYRVINNTDKFFDGQGNEFDVGDLVMEKDGSSEVIANNVKENLVTNDSVLFYTVCNDDHNTIFMIDLNTNKEKRIKKGKNIGALGCYGDYLYYGVYNPGYNYGVGVTVYAFNMNTKMKKKMGDSMGFMQYGNGRVLLQEDHTDASNTGAFLYDANGDNKKKLPLCLDCYIKDGYIYCIICRYNEDYSMDSKVVQYSLDGGDKKTVVNWTSDQTKMQDYVTDRIRLR